VSKEPIVVITGAAGALGRAAVTAFLAREARLALVDMDRGLLEKAFPQLASDSRHLLLAADVTSESSMAQTAKEILAKTGRVDSLVHIAGGFTMGESVFTLSRQTWDHMLNLNAWSFVATVKPFVESMKGSGGSIVAVTARAASAGAAQMSAYCAAKSALQRLVESLSAEVRENNIRVNSVAPSIIDTPANRAAMPDADHSRWVPTAHLAETIAFLTSEAAASIHGQHLVVAARS
jgi:NAD(P)-dependent dehydrogenase (short-subunit alcohol dehydrogenase family)